jgi:prepilin-type N-terminal cleavage/methylation domain-containing protein
MRGFTLIEMMISLSIVSVIVVACGSVVALAGKAASGGASSHGYSSSTQPSAGQTTAAQAVAIRNAMDLLTADLKMAQSIVSQSATAITFTVPDRNGNGTGETIAYSWAGVGQPLMRNYNGSGAIPIADGVQNFNLNVLNRTTAPPPPVESAEQLLMSYTGTANASTNLSTTSWESQYFNPSAIMPANAISWKITRVQALLNRRSGSSTGTITAQIRAVDAAYKPTGGALTSASVNVTAIPTTATWVDIPLTPLANLTPSSGMALVLVSSTSSSNAVISGFSGITPVPTSTQECYTTNSGTSWTTPSGAAALDFRVYGTITTQP